MSNIHESLADIKIFETRYRKDHHTFELDFSRNLADTIPQDRKLLHIDHFPTHTPFQILDEKVRIGEEVTIWLKEESLLKMQGWVDYRKSSLKSDASPFFIGGGKRKLLGKTMKGRVGITENLEPYVYVWDDFMDESYRFSPNEIKAIVRCDLTTVLKEVVLQTSEGTMFYSPQEKRVHLPDGQVIRAKWLPQLKRLIQEAGA